MGKLQAQQAIQVAGPRANNIEDMRRSAERLDETSGRSELLRSVVYYEVEPGDIAGAKKTAGVMKGERELGSALGMIAEAEAKRGDVGTARVTAASIESPEFKSSAFGFIAMAQADAGDIEGARETLANVVDAHSSAFAAEAIGSAMLKAGDTDGAMGMFAVTKAAASQMDDSGSVVNVLVPVARAEARCGKETAAKETFAYLGKRVATNPNVNSRAHRQAQIAESEALTGDFHAAVQRLEAIELDTVQVRGFCSVAKIQNRTDRDAAAVLLERAKEIAAGVKDAGRRDQAYASIAVVQVRIGLLVEADRTLTEIKGLRSIVNVLREIGEEQAKAGYVGRVLETAQREQDAEKAAMLLIGAAKGLLPEKKE